MSGQYKNSYTNATGRSEVLYTKHGLGSKTATSSLPEDNDSDAKDGDAKDDDARDGGVKNDDDSENGTDESDTDDAADDTEDEDSEGDFDEWVGATGPEHLADAYEHQKDTNDSTD